jgi:hypothetical protein
MGNLTQINPEVLEFARALATLQRRTGRLLRIPYNIQDYSPSDLNFVLLAEYALREGHFPITGAITKSIMPRLAALEILDSFLKGTIGGRFLTKDMFVIEILGQQIPIGPAKVSMSKVKPIGNIQDIYDNLKTSLEDTVTIEFEATDGAEMDLDWFQKPKKVDDNVNIIREDV